MQMWAIYAPYLHIADVRKITGQLVECKHCTQDAEPEVLFPHVYRRVFMDIAHRYIERFGGHVFVVPLGFGRWELYLRDDTGDVIATVSQFDKYTKIEEDAPNA